MIYNSATDLIGNTKMLKLSRLSKLLNNEIFVKAEHLNPFGSIKDRIVKNIVLEGFSRGYIDNNTTLIEATSGNTGIAIAAIANYHKLKCIIIMPEGLSNERIELIKHYGATVYLTDKKSGIKGAMEKMHEIIETLDNYYIIDQFRNDLNWLAHYNNTANEILEEVIPDYIVLGVGTGGTIMGCSRRFKDAGIQTKFIAVEPFESSVLSGYEASPHSIQGIGAGFIPDIIDLNFINHIQRVKSSDAVDTMKFINETECVGVGISSGANISGIISFIKENKLVNKKFVTVFPDSYSRYWSLFSE